MNAIITKVLEGEILSSKDDIRVIVALNPFAAKKQEFTVPAGTTLAEINRRIRHKALAVPGKVELDCRIGGNLIVEELWNKVRPKPNTTVVFRGRPKGFVAAIIGGISAAFSAFGSFIGGLGFLGKILMAGLSLAVKYLLNKLFAPKQPEKLPDPKTSYSIATTKNQSSPWGVVPVVLGKSRIAPFYGALPYTEMSGDDQYLRVLFIWGYGPLDIVDMKIGETALTDFTDYEIETGYGYVTDNPPTLYPNQVIEESLSVEMADTTFTQRTTAETIKEISIDIIFPNGLVRINSDGNHGQSVYIEWRYRLTGTTTWTTLPEMEIRGKTRDTIRKTYRQVVAEGQYDVAVRRSRAKGSYDDQTSDIEDVYWTALRAMRPGLPITFSDPVAYTALRIKATSQLNGNLDTFSGVCTTKATKWNGTTWINNQITRNPADLARLVLQGPMNKNPVPDDQIDLDSLAAWSEYCTAKGWSYDKIIVDRTSVYDLFQEICSAGRAMAVFKDGKWSVIWDEVSEDIVQVFTPRNSWGFEATRVYQKYPHAYRVRFVNEDKDWVEDERIVYDDGYNSGNATVFEGLDLPGVTNKDNVWKHGRYHIAANRLRPEVYTLQADFEHILCTRGDRVRINHDVMLVGLQAGRVTAIDEDTQTVTVDEWCTMLADHTYMMRFRLEDGTFLTRNVVHGTNGELMEIPLIGVDDLPLVGDLFTFGESNSDSAIYRVLSIEPGDNMSAKISFVDDAPEIADADTGTIPAFNSNVQGRPDPFQLAPSDLRYTAGIYLQEGVQYFGYVRLSWKQTRTGNILFNEVQIFRDSLWQAAGMAPGSSNTFEVDNLLSDTYQFRVRSLYQDGTASGWLTSEVINVSTLLSQVAPNVQGFRISSIGNTSTLSWFSVGIAGERYEIRFSPTTVGLADWNAATQLIPETSTTSVQVPTMVGSYFIKASSPIAAKSAIASIIYTNVLSIEGLNAVEVITESPAWAGTKSQVVVSGSTLRLDVFGTGVYVSGVYTFANSLDLLDPYTSRLSATIEAFGEDIHNHMHDWATLSSVAKLSSTDPDTWRVFLEFRTTQVNPALNTWSDWQIFVVGDVTFRAIQFRMTLQGKQNPDPNIDYSTITPVVTGLSVQIDMPDRVIADNDITVPTGGMDIVFDPPFLGLAGIATADQNMATGDRKAITAKSETGFHIQYFNSSGTAISRVMDYVAKGYGSKH